MKTVKHGKSAKGLTPMRQTLFEYLKEHDRLQKPSKTFPLVIGDAALYRTNSIYKVIRDVALDLGYEFTGQPTFDYTTYPLIHLRSILETKTIPYCDNVSGLRTLEAWRPRRFRISDLYHMAPEANHLLHESAHCVAHSMIDVTNVGERSLPRAKLARLEIIKIMIGESFANAVELIGFQQTRDHWVAPLNFYVLDPLPSLEAFEKKIGTKATFKIAIGLYLYANFLCDGLSKNEDTLIFKLAEVPKKFWQDRTFTAGFENMKALALDLSNGFRVNTTSLYLKIQNFDTRIERLLDFDPVDFILRRPLLNRQLDAMCAIFSKDASEARPAQSARRSQ